MHYLADSGQMPRPRKLGALVRWDREELGEWLSDGCPTCQSAPKTPQNATRPGKTGLQRRMSLAEAFFGNQNVDEEQ